jgi:hypothetical protein
LSGLLKEGHAWTTFNNKFFVTQTVRFEMESSKDSVSLEQISKHARLLLDAFFNHDKDETRQQVLDVAAELNLREFAITSDPEKSGHSSLEILHDSGTIEIVRYPSDSIEPLIVRGGITDLELGRTASNFACTWTEKACISTIGSNGQVKCDSGSKADDTMPRDNVAAFPGGPASINIDDLIQLFDRLPSLSTPGMNPAESPERLFDWWEELKKRFGSNAIFDADYGEETATYSFLIRGDESDILVTVRLGEILPNYKLESDKRSLKTRFHFMPMAPSGTLMLPRGE